MRLACGLAMLIVTAFAFGDEYFPADTLAATPSQHQFKAEWYAKQLSALREASLWQLSRKNAGVEVYRFLWLRSFHHPMSVSLTVASNGSGVLTSKEADGKGGYEPGKLIRNSTATLSKEQTQLFRDRVESLGFWKLAARQQGSAGLDGAQWIIEAVKGGRYQIVDRWSPPADDPIHALGTTLLINPAHFRLLYQDVY
jgi:hypothetical protein